MRSVARAILVATVTLGAALTVGTPTVNAQGSSLGGYGAMAGGTGSAMGGGSGSGTGMGAGTVAPFGGRFGAAMPSGMAGGGGLSFRPLPSAAMSNTRTAFTIGPMGGGVSGGMGQGSGRRPFVLSGRGPSGGSGLGGGMRRQMPTAGGMSVMPPSFAYPFRQPPSLVAPSAPGAGMSM